MSKLRTWYLKHQVRGAYLNIIKYEKYIKKVTEWLIKERAYLKKVKKELNNEEVLIWQKL